MIRVLGIDPGLSGGLGIVQSTEPFRPLELVAVSQIPVAGEGSRKRVDEIYLFNWIKRYGPSVAAVERVGLFPGQNVAAGGIFMRAVGVLESVPVLAGCEREMVETSVWRRYHKIPSRAKGEKDTAFKERSRQKAISIFPEAAEMIADHGIGEAVLISVYQIQKIEAGL